MRNGDTPRCGGGTAAGCRRERNVRRRRVHHAAGALGFAPARARFCRGFAYGEAMRISAALVAVFVLTTACGSHTDKAGPTTSAARVASGSTAPTPTTLSPGVVCGASTRPPAHYRHVVVIMLENRRWP